MSKSPFVLISVFAVLSCPLLLVAQNASQSDPQAVTLAKQSIARLTGGAEISDVTLNATVTSVLGSDNETGTGTFHAKGTGESRISLSLSGHIRDEVRTLTNGSTTGAWRKEGGSIETIANHNCWTDAVWFFPALSSLTQTGSTKYVFKYIGQEQHGGLNTQHLQVFQPSPVALIQHLSVIDFYLDPTSTLPMAVSFQVHPDTHADRDIPEEVRFANYQSLNGILVPHSIQKMLNGGVVLDISVGSVAVNSGLSDSTFTLQ